MGRGRPKKIQSHRLSPDERGRAIGMREMGAGIKEIARPDMNPIEHLWKKLKDVIYQRADKASNLDQVFEFVNEEWSKIPLEQIETLVASMPERVEALYKSRGKHTKY